MSKDIVWFAENVYKLKLNEQQKEMLIEIQNAKNSSREIFINFGRLQGKGLLVKIVLKFEMWLKDQQIAELKKALQLACEQIWAMSTWGDKSKAEVVTDNCNLFLERAKEGNHAIKK